jgi:hypothetical protein
LERIFKTPVEVRVKGSLTQVQSTEELPNRPRKANACSGNQQPNLIEPLIKRGKAGLPDSFIEEKNVTRGLLNGLFNA